MKPDERVPSRAASGQQRRGVRLFVALHLGAVGTIYAIALAVGGGFSGPPMPPIPTMPPIRVAPATPLAVPPALTLGGAVPSPRTNAPARAPEWTQRAEVSAPWELR